MYVKTLYLYESDPAKKLIRKIDFKKGMNFIVDASISDDEKGNSVGKTTVLKLIDICFGAGNRKYIYTDHEINNENPVLKQYIFEKKIYAELIISEDFSDDQLKTHSLKVDLYSRGYRYIDEEKLSMEAFNEKLNLMIFNNNINIPTFRELIKMFVRIDQKSDNDKFLRYLHTNTTNVQYENIYSYLFKLADQDLGKQILKLKQEIKTISDDVKEHKKLNNIKNINAVEQRLLDSSQEILELKGKIAALVDVEKFKEDEKKVQEIKLIYSQILDKINFFEFKQKKVEETLENAKQEVSKSINTDVLRNLYDETKNNFNELNKTFTELLAFNKQLLQNKINYFEIQLNNINKNMENLNLQKEDLLKKHKNLIMLIKSNKLDEYTKLQGDLEKITEEKGRLEQIKSVYDDLNTKLKKQTDRLAEIDNQNNNQDNIIKIFNEKFVEYSRKIIKEKYFLFPTGETFPIGIDNEKTGLSTGTKKSIIAAFDLAYQVFSNRLTIDCPKFIVHDVIETMDDFALSNIIDITNEIECQYIIAVLHEKIINNSHVSDSDIRLTLSENEKLFKI